MEPRRFHLRVCRGPECGDRRNSRAIYDELRRVLAARGLGDRCVVEWQSCFGRCTQGPNLLVREIVADPAAPRATALYNGVEIVNVDEVVREHVAEGVVVTRLIRAPLFAGRLAVPPSRE